MLNILKSIVGNYNQGSGACEKTWIICITYLLHSRICHFVAIVRDVTCKVEVSAKIVKVQTNIS